MEIEYDEVKDAANIQTRGISLMFGATVIEGAAAVIEDRRNAYGETRMKAFAEIDGLWFACVFTMRGSVHHIITVHRVRQKEVERWLRG